MLKEILFENFFRNFWNSTIFNFKKLIFSVLRYPVDGEVKEYIEQIKIMKENMSYSLYVDFSHVQSFQMTLANRIEEEYYR